MSLSGISVAAAAATPPAPPPAASPAAAAAAAPPSPLDTYGVGVTLRHTVTTEPWVVSLPHVNYALLAKCL